MENKNSPAYPITLEDTGNPGISYFGLTKREYIASQILSGLLVPNPYTIKESVDKAIDAADALLNKLENG